MAVVTLAVIFLTVALYWQGLKGPFLLDDFTNTTLIRLDTLSWPAIMDVAFSNDSGFLRRPISNLSFALNYYFSGLDRFIYKYTNLMIHLLTGLALFWLGGRLLLVYLGKSQERRAWLISAAATALWLTHPLQVSTVLYVVQRMAQLSALFTVGALLTFVIGRQRLSENRPFGFTIMALGVTGFGTLAVLSKETGALIPLFILVIEFFLFLQPPGARRARAKLLAFHVLFVVIPIVGGFFYFILHANSLLSYGGREFTLAERLLTEPHVLLFYLRLILLPSLKKFGLFHDDFPTTTALDLPAILAISALAILLGLIPALRHKAPLLSFGIAWFFTSHLLESTVLPLELVFEHRNYLASFGLLFSLTYYVTHPWPRIKKTLQARVVFVALFLVFTSAITFLRVETWSTTTGLFTSLVRNHPQSLRSHVGLAQLHRNSGDLANSLRHVKLATDIAPWDPSLPVIKLWMMCRQEEIDPAHTNLAIEKIKEARYPRYLVAALFALQKEVFSGRCRALAPQILLPLTQAILTNSELAPKVRKYLIYILQARTLAYLGNYTQAIQVFDQAYQANQGDLTPLFEKAQLEIKLRRIKAAEDTIMKLRKIDKYTVRNYALKIDRLESYLRRVTGT